MVTQSEVKERKTEEKKKKNQKPVYTCPSLNERFAR